MRTKLGTACMALGVALLLAALSLCCLNWYENVKAGEAADAVVGKLECGEWTVLDASSAVPEVQIDGNAYMGRLAIPSQGLNLPVMADWSYAQLKTAPCRYAGSAATNDLVIAAHDYSSHFGRLKYLSAGDAVLFTGVDGVRGTYEVVSLEKLPPTAVEDMTAGEFDLTLFTCTYDGRSRLAVRCERTNGL